MCSTPLQQARAKARADKAQSTRKKADRWAFDTAYGDHFETPSIAYQHLLPMLRALARRRRKGIPAKSALEQLEIYDPYFCKGSVTRCFRSLGCHAVTNQNRDFYVDVSNSTCPAHEVLVTNPPFSGDHKERLLTHLLESRKPFCLLMPSWVAKRAYWRQFLWATSKRHIDGRPARLEDAEIAKIEEDVETRARCFYFCPARKYEFRHVDRQQEKTSPFYSLWFIGGMRPKMTARAKKLLNAADGQVCSTLAELISAGMVATKAELKQRAKEQGGQPEAKRKHWKQERKAEPPGAAAAGKASARKMPEDEQKASTRKRKRGKCSRYFNKGSCNRGDACPYSHV